jgi:hypothetical protein
MRNAQKILVLKPQARKPLRWEDNIEIDRKEIGHELVDWI